MQAHVPSRPRFSEDDELLGRMVFISDLSPSVGRPIFTDADREVGWGGEADGPSPHETGVQCIGGTGKQPQQPPGIGSLYPALAVCSISV